ncbi:MAG: hypothetical protein BroJett025_01540 [Patescibacteria group bacterium]|nr:MAG: hypothetical protein BroJett025_01540 [Patescibacteria group bacterium]
MKFLKFKQESKGFTLLEILVVISIIGILIALGASAYSTAQKKSRDARRQGDLKQIQNAFEQYYTTNSSAYTACATMDDIFPSGTRPSDPKGGSWPDYNCTQTASTYCVCAQLETTGAGNATSLGAGGTCAYGTGDYFCVSNLQ